jgi:hypothetical protein
VERFPSSTGSSRQIPNSLHCHSCIEGILTLNRHHPSAVRDILIKNSRLRGDLLSHRQKVALNNFHRQEVLDLKGDNGYSRVEVLKAYSHFFDEMFFFGTLKPRCGLLFFVRHEGEIACSGRTQRLEKQRGLDRMLFGPKRQVVTLSLYLYEREHRSRRAALEDYRGTLLHEMIHCFLGCWACDYDKCRDANEVLGQGHGPICR